MNTHETGSRYERYAKEYLEQQGYRVILSNYRCPVGEIDLIAEDGEYLCFVEVKYRADIHCGYPQEAVGAAKQRRIRKTAAWYLAAEHPVQAKYRFDVVGICPAKTWLIQNAFGGL